MKPGWFLLLGIAGALNLSAAETRVKDVARVGGVRDMELVGYGLVTGLRGTGDRPGSGPAAQSLVNLLNRLGVAASPQELQSSNIAAVAVTAASGASGVSCTTARRGAARRSSARTGRRAPFASGASTTRPSARRTGPRPRPRRTRSRRSTTTSASGSGHSTSRRPRRITRRATTACTRPSATPSSGASCATAAHSPPRCSSAWIVRTSRRTRTSAPRRARRTRHAARRTAPPRPRASRCSSDRLRAPGSPGAPTLIRRRRELDACGTRR